MIILPGDLRDQQSLATLTGHAGLRDRLAKLHILQRSANVFTR